METTTLDLVNNVSEFLDIADFMQDEELEKALALVVKLMVNPDVPATKAAVLITELQAYSAKFGILASYYTNIKKDDRAKKNIYYSMREALDRLVDALKYNTRSYYG